jgi:phospholipase C
MNFTFDRLGLRVPAILVSAYTKAGTVVNDEMHHGSVINTLNRIHGLKPLTLRDNSANNLFNAINLARGRQPALWPDVHPAFVPPNPEEVPEPMDKFRSRPLSSPAEGLLGLLLAKYAPGTPRPQNYGEAFDNLVLHGKGLFGTVDDPDAGEVDEKPE